MRFLQRIVVPAASQPHFRKYHGHCFPAIYQADVREARLQLGEHYVRTHLDRHGTHSFRVILLWPRDSFTEQIFTPRNGTTAEVVIDVS